MRETPGSKYRQECQEEAGLSDSQRGLQGIKLLNTDIYAIDAVCRIEEPFRRAEFGNNSSGRAERGLEHLYMPKS